MGHVGVMGHSDSDSHIHRANSVSCGNINVSSFIDDYSQQERGHLFHTQTLPPNRREGTREERKALRINDT